jgi:hypothetical protein
VTSSYQHRETDGIPLLFSEAAGVGSPCAQTRFIESPLTIHHGEITSLVNPKVGAPPISLIRLASPVMESQVLLISLPAGPEDHAHHTTSMNNRGDITLLLPFAEFLPLLFVVL